MRSIRLSAKGGIIAVSAVVAFIVYLGIKAERRPMQRPVEELRIRIALSGQLPDPTRIVSTGDWYYLEHVSSGLVAFDTKDKKFVPLLSDKWSSRPDGTHVFRLRDGIQFNDGSPITAKDVLWTIKRHLILKTSTHFPLWEYLVGCDKLRSLDDDCPGISVNGEKEIVFRLKSQADSFFLQMASPETGIWSASDMDPKRISLNPTRYSGPYAMATSDEGSILLKRNENAIRSREFPNSPRHIRIKRVPLSKVDDSLRHGEVDLVVRSYRPLGEPDWSRENISVRSTTPSTILYLFGAGRGNHPAIGRDFIEQAWKGNRDTVLTPAGTFLPFSSDVGLMQSDFLSELPEKTAKHVKVFCPADFFSPAFLEQLRIAGQAVGANIEFVVGSAKDWAAAFDDPNAAEKYDYLLASYAASERYPAVQLRYITGKLVHSDFDLKRAETPDLNSEQISLLRNYQKWLLRSRTAIPIYFNVTSILYRKTLDIGHQPDSDAEIELWRVQERGG